MNQLKELLVEELRDLLHAEGQLLSALPKMAEAAHNPKLKEAFLNHQRQTEGQVDRLRSSFDLLGEEPQPRACRAMMGLVEEGEETIKDSAEKPEPSADLGLIAAAQRVEHYEIAGYGTARTLARQIGAWEVATLLAQSLGEEASSDHVLTELSKPLLQQASMADTAAESKPSRAAKQKG